MMKMDVLRGKMAEKRISQKKLAEELMISENTMSDKLNEKRSLTIYEAFRICEILGIKDDEEKGYIFLS